MLEIFPSREEVVEGSIIVVYDLTGSPRSFYSSCYRSLITRVLDDSARLNGEPLKEDDTRRFLLTRMTGRGVIGKLEVEKVLTYFANLAIQVGNFVGVEEDELRRNICAGKIKTFHDNDVDLALRYSEHGEDPHIKRIKVRDKNVLFPANLEVSVF